MMSYSTFSMQWSLVHVYHVLHTGRYPRMRLGAKLKSSFLISTHVFLCTRSVSNDPWSISTKFTYWITVWEWL